MREDPDWQLTKAIIIASLAHDGQTDKAGAAYILHPLRVMLALPEGDARVAGVLHDVVEDNENWTIERLRESGFSEAVISAVDAVTRREGESYNAFIDRARLEPIGRVVKLADLRDNMDLSRLKRIATDEDYRRLAKYAKAAARL